MDNIGPSKSFGSEEARDSIDHFSFFVGWGCGVNMSSGRLMLELEVLLKFTIFHLFVEKVAEMEKPAR